MNNETLYNISNSERVARVVLGVGVILDVVFHASGPLGWVAILPILSIYPGLTGFIGYDPIYAMFGFSTANECIQRKDTPRRRHAHGTPAYN